MDGEGKIQTLRADKKGLCMSRGERESVCVCVCVCVCELPFCILLTHSRSRPVLPPKARPEPQGKQIFVEIKLNMYLHTCVSFSLLCCTGPCAPPRPPRQPACCWTGVLTSMTLPTRLRALWMLPSAELLTRHSLPPVAWLAALRMYCATRSRQQ
jgi:hypothetical protein